MRPSFDFRLDFRSVCKYLDMIITDAAAVVNTRASRAQAVGDRALPSLSENPMVFSPAYGNTACFGTVGRNRGAFWGSQSPRVAVPGGPLSRRCVLMSVVAARSLITHRLEKGSAAACRVRAGECVQNRTVFMQASPKTCRKTRRSSMTIY